MLMDSREKGWLRKFLESSIYWPLFGTAALTAFSFTSYGAINIISPAKPEIKKIAYERKPSPAVEDLVQKYEKEPLRVFSVREKSGLVKYDAPRYQEYDEIIKKSANYWNNHFKNIIPGFVPIDPNDVKRIVLVEARGDENAWNSNPMQMTQIAWQHLQQDDPRHHLGYDVSEIPLKEIENTAGNRSIFWGTRLLFQKAMKFDKKSKVAEMRDFQAMATRYNGGGHADYISHLNNVIPEEPISNNAQEKPIISDSPVLQDSEKGSLDRLIKELQEDIERANKARSSLN